MLIFQDPENTLWKQFLPNDFLIVTFVCMLWPENHVYFEIFYVHVYEGYFYHTFFYKQLHFAPAEPQIFENHSQATGEP